MNSLLYRDLLKPDPLWEEVGEYGGYMWIQWELDKNVWISRRWESQLTFFMHCKEKGFRDMQRYGCTLACMQELKDLMIDNNLLIGEFQSYTNIFNIQSENQLLEVINSKRYVQDVIRVDANSRTMYAQFYNALKHCRKVNVIGYSTVIIEVCEALAIHNICTDSQGYGEYARLMDKQALIQLTERELVIVPSSDVGLKGGVLNWGNVITY